MRTRKSRTVGAAFVLLQGLVTAVFPQISIKFIKDAIGKNFENASELEVKPAYLRQLRALGVGLVAASGTTLLLQSRAAPDDGPAEADVSADDADAQGGRNDEQPN
ncbi:hypothetical protein [Halorientalis sp.]|jgi:hypothetical protein|uniref:hypothetical protein n=1 Tax=Halorientalis sp. TaxID=1931229 RepID=UPI00261DB801|nr:hypothetical protein [Halorientalis sp.]